MGFIDLVERIGNKNLADSEFSNLNLVVNYKSLPLDSIE